MPNLFPAPPDLSQSARIARIALVVGFLLAAMNILVVESKAAFVVGNGAAQGLKIGNGLGEMIGSVEWLVTTVRSDWNHHASARIAWSGASAQFAMPLRSNDSRRPGQNSPCEHAMGFAMPCGAATDSRNGFKRISTDSLMGYAFEVSDASLICWRGSPAFLSLVSTAISELLRPPIFVS